MPATGQTPAVPRTVARFVFERMDHPVTSLPRTPAMTTQQPTIIYTLTDEAPLLATCAFLPIIRTFTAPAGIRITKSDISVSARILAGFSDLLPEGQKVPDTLAE